jgi:hypothetical protein
VLLTAAISYPILFLLAFLVKFVGNARHPDFHKEWLREPPWEVRLSPPSFRVSIKSKIGAPYLERHCCRVRHPNGSTYEALADAPSSGFRFFLYYPSDFAAAAPPVTGCYEITWLLPGSSGKLREVIHHSERISFE